MTMSKTDKAGGKTHKRIGDLLIDHELITEAMLIEALEAQKKSGDKIVEILISLGHLTVQQFVNFLSRQPGIASTP